MSEPSVSSSSSPPPEKHPGPATRFSGGHSRLPVAWRLVLGLLGMVGLGTLLLALPGMTTEPLSLMDLLFTATSAVTVTGLAVVTTSTAFTPLGQFVLMCLIQVGGLGYVVLVVLAFRVMRRQVPLAERMTLASELGLAKTRSIVSILQRSLLLMLVIEAIGAALLFVHWSLEGLPLQGRTLFYALFHSVAAFCNAGFDLFTGLPPAQRLSPVDIPTFLILGTIVILGGLGIPVFMDLTYRRGARRRLSLHSRVTLAASLILILAGMAAIWTADYWLGGALADAPLGWRLTLAWFQSVVTRTAGFPGLITFIPLNSATILVLMGLMFIGSGPASMGGGITTGTFSVLLITVLSIARGRSSPQLGGRAISLQTVQRAMAVLVVAASAVGVAIWLLLLLEPFSLQEVAFEVISAFSTVGLSLGITPQLSTAGRLIVMATMFWGRLGAMTVVAALVQRRASADLVEYPEADLLVG
jgi:trk system potassium uptake protein TrkH